MKKKLKIKNIQILALILTGLIVSANAVVANDGDTVYSVIHTSDKKPSTYSFYKILYDQKEMSVMDDSLASKAVGIGLDKGGNGFIVTSDGNLDYYENGKFIRTTHTFDDGANGLSVTPDAIYVITGNKSYYNEKALKKCSKDGYSCITIDTFKDYPQGVSFKGNGSGYVVAGHYLYKYVGDEYIARVHTFEDSVNAVSYTGHAAYVITQGTHGNVMSRTALGQLFKCTLENNAQCRVIDTFYDEYPSGVSFDDYGNGFVDGGACHGEPDSGLTIFKYSNDVLNSYYLFADS